VEDKDKIAHRLDLEEDMKGEENLNIFRLDPKYEETETQWDSVKKEILGEENIARLKEPMRTSSSSTIRQLNRASRISPSRTW
jgi:hypothetical protein